MLLYAKSLSGDLHRLELDWKEDAEERMPIYPLIHRILGILVCPDDPSRLRLVSAQTNVGAWEPAEGDALDGLLDEITEELGSAGTTGTTGSAVAVTGSVDGEDMTQAAFERRTWYDGDVVLYWVDDPIPLSVTMMDLFWAHYRLEDVNMERPLYPCTVYVEQDVGQKKREVVYSWRFFFDLQAGRYYGAREAWMEEDDGYPHVIVRGEGGGSLESVLRGAQEIPERYRRLMLRACRRKWVRILRRMSQATIAERAIGATHVTELFAGEKAAFREHWWRVKAEGQRVR